MPHIASLVVAHTVALGLFGVHVPPAQALTLLPLLFVISVLPIAPSGIGTAQATAVAFFARFADAPTVAGREAQVLAYGLSLQFAALILQAMIGLGFLRRVTKAVTVGEVAQIR